MSNLHEICGSLWGQSLNDSSWNKIERTCRVYLVDWKYVLNTEVQLLQWKRDHSQVPICLNMDMSKFVIVKDEVEKAVDHVQKITYGFSPSRMVHLVGSTYPMVSSDYGDELDLVDKRKQYRMQMLLK